MGLLVIASIASINTAQAQAGGDIENGRALSTSCSACHGTDGMSTSEQWPNLAGQKESYLVTQLNNYKSGARSNPTMAALVGPLNDQDILDLAAYFSAQTAIASFDFDTLLLSVPYVEVGDATFDVEMSLDDVNNLIFSVKKLTQR